MLTLYAEIGRAIAQSAPELNYIGLLPTLGEGQQLDMSNNPAVYISITELRPDNMIGGYTRCEVDFEIITLIQPDLLCTIVPEEYYDEPVAERFDCIAKVRRAISTFDTEKIWSAKLLSESLSRNMDNVFTITQKWTACATPGFPERQWCRISDAVEFEYTITR